MLLNINLLMASTRLVCCYFARQVLVGGAQNPARGRGGAVASEEEYCSDEASSPAAGRAGTPLCRTRSCSSARSSRCNCAAGLRRGTLLCLSFSRVHVCCLQECSTVLGLRAYCLRCLLLCLASGLCTTARGAGRLWKAACEVVGIWTGDPGLPPHGSRHCVAATDSHIYRTATAEAPGKTGFPALSFPSLHACNTHSASDRLAPTTHANN